MRRLALAGAKRLAAVLCFGSHCATRYVCILHRAGRNYEMTPTERPAFCHCAMSSHPVELTTLLSGSDSLSRWFLYSCVSLYLVRRRHTERGDARNRFHVNVHAASESVGVSSLADRADAVTPGAAPRHPGVSISPRVTGDGSQFPT